MSIYIADSRTPFKQTWFNGGCNILFVCFQGHPVLLQVDKCTIHISWATSAACPETQTAELDKCRVFDNSTGLYYSLKPLAKNNDLGYYQVVWLLMYQSNGPFPSSLVPLFQSESECETFLMKMTLTCMRMNLHAGLIFISKVSHIDSFWNGDNRTRKWPMGTCYIKANTKKKVENTMRSISDELRIWSNTVWRVWYIFSMEAKTKENTEKWNRKTV